MIDSNVTRAGAVLTIDLDALCDNWRLLRRQAEGAECAAVVKADAYGLGAERVAPALYRAGCRSFFVAHLTEGIHLRAVLPDQTAMIYVLHGPHPGSERDFVRSRLVPVLNSLPQVKAWQTLAQWEDGVLPAVLQVDTGMARLGLSEDEFASLIAHPALLEGLALQFVMSHLVSAEAQHDPVNRRQLARFEAALAQLPGMRGSLANSSGIFLGGEYHFGLVRPGAALYGVAPVAGQANPMRPVIRLQGKVLQTRRVDAGTAVGYGHSWMACRPSRLATVAVGYADGYLRSLSNRGLARYEDVPLPLVGKVSMDTIIVDVTDVPEARIVEGAFVDLADPINGVDAVAERAGTIGYEILTSLGRRYARQYIEGGRIQPD
ncbi:alanine racemase [Zoogloea sp. 1C4]|uniref:alanine racemase n=1 Tax=Zoogloea sp. 1C4 TaxID=2570190 RepID=UPI0012911B26|nr:alanine racemase [Zoogloea sp. 1C4]